MYLTASLTLLRDFWNTDVYKNKVTAEPLLYIYHDVAQNITVVGGINTYIYLS